MIIAIETGWHVFIAFLIFMVGFFLVLYFSKKLKISTYLCILLYLWHTFFSIVYMYYTLAYGGDSIGYYNRAISENVNFEIGTHFIEYFASLVVSLLGVSYLGLFLFFNILGSLGLIILHANLASVTLHCSKCIRQLNLLIVFLPSVSFWSSALGKDSISFLATNLALWAALNVLKRKILMAISILLMLLIRPHIAGIMIIALALSLVITNKQISLINRVAIATVVASVAIILVPFAVNYAGIENITEVNEYIKIRQGYNMEGGGSVDISNMPLPMQVFTYLFRPLPYEAHNVFAFISSLDNLVLLLLFLYAIRFTRIRLDIPAKANHAFLWLYIISSTLILAMTTANLGISARQKWMIMPMLLYLLFAGIAAQRARKQRKKQRKAHATASERLSLR